MKTSANHRSLRQLEYYTHRCGRTARTGKKGLSLALITPKEKWQFTQLEDKLKVRFSEFRR
ncbi:hypothetical protein [Prosthecobacter sp.]|uniref:hypothetical protein n=1 Tax=Prosthecobacter sp. TaxID=1965333 RepID=UPI00248950AA|nr:hypothetical protein [Prosthecobacter sp.]MDI1312787.1 hypothetical protein [Prosthecobacter sp.]